MDQLNEHPEPQDELGSDTHEKGETSGQELNASTSMESLLAQEEVSLDLPQVGEIREGVVVSISENEALVSIGTKSEGIIPGRELQQLPEEARAKIFEGAHVTVYVVTPEDSQGNLILSLDRALEEADWDLAEDLLKSGKLFDGEITGYNRGGLIVNYGRLRGFIPASQLSPSRRTSLQGAPDQRWNKILGEKIIARAVEVDRDRRRLIFSEMAALQEAREIYKERLLENIQEGDELKGRVTSLAQFGAFVNINGADGLVHLTEVSWERIKHPGEVLKVGQEVTVKVISVDRENRRIGLSLRALQQDPWPIKASKLQEGQLIEGTIIRLTKFGAFARLPDDMEGLIHISELSEKRVENPGEVVKEGDVLTLRIINIDKENHRIALSLRKVHSSAYADLDLQMAMKDFTSEDETPPAPPEETPGS